MKNKIKLKKGDEVIVLTGKDKGKTGKIVRVIPNIRKVVVADVNKSPIKMLGHVTSSYYSPNLKKSIALGVVRGGKNMMGQKLIIPMEKKNINVTVADPVFLDKENKRLNA